MADAAPAVDFILEVEGKVTLDGLTKWGIDRTRHPEITDVRWSAWTEDDSAALFVSGYWTPHRCGELPWPWALGIFDGLVNQGSATPGWAQTALGIKLSNRVDDATVAACAKASPDDFHLFLALRAMTYTRLSSFPTYGKGWIKRLMALAMAAAVPPPSP